MSYYNHWPKLKLNEINKFILCLIWLYFIFPKYISFPTLEKIYEWWEFKFSEEKTQTVETDIYVIYFYYWFIFNIFKKKQFNLNIFTIILYKLYIHWIGIEFICVNL